MAIPAPPVSISFPRCVAACLAFWVIMTGTAGAQTAGTSPVFKSYTPPRPGAIVEQSDVTYQLWHTFDLARRAGAGDVLAQQELAVRYLTGRGIKADTVRGAFWTVSAAAQNMPPARFNLGILYSNGWGVDWNPFVAYDQFLWCAERGMPESQYILGTLLMENLVLPRDWHAALHWLQAAADSGYAPARELVESMRRRGEAGQQEDVGVQGVVPRDSLHAPSPGSTLPWTPVFLDFKADTGTSVDDALLLTDLLRDVSSDTLRSLGLSDSAGHLEEAGPAVLEAVERSAEAGSPEALTLLARCRERGVGVPRDTVQAAALYVRAIRLDSPRAPELLMGLLGNPRSMTTIRSRSTSGDPAASFVLASLVGLGLTHPLLSTRTWLTDDEAVRILRRSAADGYRPAAVELGVWYYAGRLVARDKDRALALWTEAEAGGSPEAGVRLAVARLESGASVGPNDIGFLTAAVAKGSVLAQMALGYCLEVGRGVPQNRAGAARLYRTAAQRGSQDAYRALLRLHDAIRPAERRFELREE
jgi:uncharacterized protein